VTFTVFSASTHIFSDTDQQPIRIQMQQFHTEIVCFLRKRTAQSRWRRSKASRWLWRETNTPICTTASPTGTTCFYWRSFSTCLRNYLTFSLSTLTLLDPLTVPGTCSSEVDHSVYSSIPRSGGNSYSQLRIEDRRAEAGWVFWGVDSHQLGGLGSGVSSPSGVWAEPQPKSNFVHFSRESW